MASDPDATTTVEALLGQPGEQRDQAWHRALLAVLPDAPLVALDPQLVRGPDGFGYVALGLPGPDAGADRYSVRHVQEACTDAGYGCVVAGADGETAWVLRYGEMWTLRTEGRLAPPVTVPDPLRTTAEEEVLVGAPGADVLPAWARDVLRTALVHVGVAAPQVALVVHEERAPGRSLVLGPMAAVAEPDRHHLTWYLPAHLGLIFDDDDRFAEASVPL